MNFSDNFLKTLQPGTPMLQHSALKCAYKGNLALQYYRLVPSIPFPRPYVLYLLTTCGITSHLIVLSWAKRQISFQLLFYHCYWHRAQTRKREIGQLKMIQLPTPLTSWHSFSWCLLHETVRMYARSLYHPTEFTPNYHMLRNQLQHRVEEGCQKDTWRVSPVHSTFGNAVSFF